MRQGPIEHDYYFKFPSHCLFIVAQYSVVYILYTPYQCRRQSKRSEGALAKSMGGH